MFVSLSNEISFVNLKKALKCFLISSDLLIGHTFVFNTFVVKTFRSFLKSSHSNNKWSIVWSWLPHVHFGVSFILKRCRYEFILPWPVTIRVKLWVRFSFMFSLAVMSGKYCLVICPFWWTSLSCALYGQREHVIRSRVCKLHPASVYIRSMRVKVQWPLDYTEWTELSGRAGKRETVRPGERAEELKVIPNTTKRVNRLCLLSLRVIRQENKQYKYLVTYLLTFLLHAAESFLRS